MHEYMATRPHLTSFSTSCATPLTAGCEFFIFSDTFAPQGVYLPSKKPTLDPMRLSVVVMRAPRITLLKVTPERNAIGMASQSRQKTLRSTHIGRSSAIAEA